MITEISSLEKDELRIYSEMTEPELRHYYEPHGGIFIAESPKVIARALDAGCTPISVLADKRELEEGKEAGEASKILRRCAEVPVYVAEEKVLLGITGFRLTRGILCAMRRPQLPDLSELCRGKKRIVFLEDVVNPTNVGAIFRSAAALGMEAVVLTPGSSDPLYRRAARVSMGTVFQIPWTYGPAPAELPRQEWPQAGIRKLKELGFATAAMALRNDTVSIDDPRLTREEKLAVVLGTEGDGLAAKSIEACDYTIKIPMAHGVDSLNVAAAAAVAFWELGLCRHRD
uniref:TrmH family RNA methyltransferase n=1 Tax=Eubacterium cellulosolvens TaxID=29322 RepID=UPI000482D3AE|nr:RNA methyltransferase [[Eubacterium] cellulosolvens]